MGGDSLSRSMSAAGTSGRISTTTDPCRVSSPWASQLEDQSRHLCQLVFFLIRSRHHASVGVANSVSMQRWCVALDTSTAGLSFCSFALLPRYRFLLLRSKARGHAWHALITAHLT